MIEESSWSEIAEGTVKAATVVEGFEIIEKSKGSGAPGGERLAFWEDFIFYGGEGTFSEGIIIAVAPGAHTLEEAGPGQKVADLG